MLTRDKLELPVKILIMSWSSGSELVVEPRDEEGLDSEIVNQRISEIVR